MNVNFDPLNIEDNGQLIDSLPPTWFEAEITFQQICRCFGAGRQEIRIACGFFTVKGWGKIRNYTSGKRVYLLVGIDEPGEERARAALVKEILRELATGLDRNRRQAVQDLVQRMESGLLQVLDARAMNHHAKLYLVDRDVAIVSSANTTYRGFIEQIEAGGLYGPPLVERFIQEHAKESDVAVTPVVIEALYRFIQVHVNHYIDKFDEYFALAKDITQELLDALKRWLDFVRPWDIYLKTILALEELQPLKSNYKKEPVSYQKDMIAQTLRQIREKNGSMLVASTGLGKTVVATLVAIHLRQEDEIDNVIVVCPVAVRNTWKREMRDAGLHADYFTLSALDKKSSDSDSSLEDFEEITQSITSGRYFLIIDESHQLRNRYSDEFSNRRYRKEQRIERLAFTRLRSLVQAGNLKVLLLSGSPYAKDIDNINTQLLLLPHTAESRVLLPEFVDDAQSWHIDRSDDFIHLPVASQLTTPHVAKYYGQTDSQGTYIDFSGEKKYIPHVILHSINIPLLFESDLIPVITDGYFDLDTTHPIYRKNIETQVKTAWASSPLAIQEVIERVVDTPGGPKEFDFAKKGNSAFVVSNIERQQVLNPIINELRRLTFEDDWKLKALLQIIEESYSRNEKVLVFCERLSTAFYLEQGLAELIPSLQVFSTIIKDFSKNLDKYKQKKSKDIEEAIAKFAPEANRAVGKHKETYDVFIATDAYGIGVNMQDASVVVNYDIAWTPVEPVQRSGRILRLWNLPRIVQLYTFIPKVITETNIRYELLNFEQRWENLMVRHGESQKLIDLPVLTTDKTREIHMSEVASQVTIRSEELDLQSLADQDISPFFQHAAKLQDNREYAENIPGDIISTKTYPGQNPLIYVLLRHNDKYRWLTYDAKTKQLHSLNVVKLLDLIACTEDTETALVEHDQVEKLSDACIQAWCEQEGVNPEEVVRECALYLKPEGGEDTVKNWLNPQEENRC